MSCQPNTSIPQNPPSGGANHFLAKMLVRGTHSRPERRRIQPDTECTLTEHSSLPSRDHVSARLDLRFGRPTVRWSRRRSHHEADCWRRCRGGGWHLWTAMLSRPASDDNQSCPPRANVARVLEGIQRHARDHVWNAADLRRTVHSLPMVLGQSQTIAVLLRVPNSDLDRLLRHCDRRASVDGLAVDLSMVHVARGARSSSTKVEPLSSTVPSGSPQWPSLVATKPTSTAGVRWVDNAGMSTTAPSGATICCFRSVSGLPPRATDGGPVRGGDCASASRTPERRCSPIRGKDATKREGRCD